MGEGSEGDRHALADVDEREEEVGSGGVGDRQGGEEVCEGGTVFCEEVCELVWLQLEEEPECTFEGWLAVGLGEAREDVGEELDWRSTVDRTSGEDVEIEESGVGVSLGSSVSSDLLPEETESLQPESVACWLRGGEEGLEDGELGSGVGEEPLEDGLGGEEGWSVESLEEGRKEVEKVGGRVAADAGEDDLDRWVVGSEGGSGL